jgi:hypothetical protein
LGVVFEPEPFYDKRVIYAEWRGDVGATADTKEYEDQHAGCCVTFSPTRRPLKPTEQHQQDHQTGTNWQGGKRCYLFVFLPFGDMPCIVNI